MSLRQHMICRCHYWLLRLLSGSWQIQASGLPELEKRLVDATPVIAVFWHGDFPALMPLLRGKKVCVFTSVSWRGDIIACTLSRFGYDAVQIPDRGGERSLATMKAALQTGRSAAIAVDGPLGPFHEVHRGAVSLAAELGYPLVPISMCAAKNWVISQRWDRLHIPRPFSKVSLVIGPPMRMRKDMTHAQLKQCCASVGDALDSSTNKARLALKGRG